MERNKYGDDHLQTGVAALYPCSDDKDIKEDDQLQSNMVILYNIHSWMHKIFIKAVIFIYSYMKCACTYNILQHAYMDFKLAHNISSILTCLNIT